MKYKIQKGIPLPPHAQRKHETACFPFKNMVPGDCIMVDWREYNAAKSMAQRVSAKKAGYKFISRDCGIYCGFWCIGPESGVIVHKIDDED